MKIKKQITINGHILKLELPSFGVALASKRILSKAIMCLSSETDSIEDIDFDNCAKAIDSFVTNKTIEEIDLILASGTEVDFFNLVMTVNKLGRIEKADKKK